MRILQLSDPHLVADPRGLVRGRPPLAQLVHGLAQARAQLAGTGEDPDLLLLSGDLCDDEGWGGYARLRDFLDTVDLPVALLPGNHDHPALLRAALARRCRIAPLVLELVGWRVVLLDSHRAGQTAGWLGERQRDWLQRELSRLAPETAVLVAVHHPPGPIGDAGFDAIGLRDGQELLALLGRTPGVRGVVFGHVHQHWQGELAGPGSPVLLGCPSTLVGFGPVQPCPLGRADDPGGRLLELSSEGEIRHRLLRWSLPERPSFGS